MKITSNIFTVHFKEDNGCFCTTVNAYNNTNDLKNETGPNEFVCIHVLNNSSEALDELCDSLRDKFREWIIMSPIKFANPSESKGKKCSVCDGGPEASWDCQCKVL